jgi:hypothetical protein
MREALGSTDVFVRRRDGTCSARTTRKPRLVAFGRPRDERALWRLTYLSTAASR